MMNSAYRLYIKRKLGFGNSLKYKISALLPILIVLLITMILVFSLIFITSISAAIEKAIIYLGSGEIYSKEDISDKDFIKTSYPVKNGQGIIYGENGESLVYIKGVESSYFDDDRMAVFHIADAPLEKNSIIISESLSSALSLNPGDKLTLLLYESDKGRARPYLMTVSAVFDSGYKELEKYLAFVDISMLESAGVGYESTLRSGFNTESAIIELSLEGIHAESYKTLYSSIYQNVRSSVSVLYVIFGAIAILAAFFSSDAARVYIDRDKKDIGAMLLLGTSHNALRRIYLRITVCYIFIAALLGSVFGILLSLRIPSLISFIAREHSAFLDYYIKEFSIIIPYSSLFFIVLIVVAVSAISLIISLGRLLPRDIDSLVKGE